MCFLFKDFHQFVSIFLDCLWFSWISISFHRFSLIFIGVLTWVKEFWNSSRMNPKHTVTQISK